jgi:hypothetical protein
MKCARGSSTMPPVENSAAGRAAPRIVPVMAVRRIPILALVAGCAGACGVIPPALRAAAARLEQVPEGGLYQFHASYYDPIERYHMTS